MDHWKWNGPNIFELNGVGPCDDGLKGIGSCGKWASWIEPMGFHPYSMCGIGDQIRMDQISRLVWIG